MKTILFLLTASTLSTLTTALTLKTRAATFTSFPSPLTCPTASGSSTWSLSELESLAQEVITSGKEPIETSASNAASGRCTSIKLPYYSADLLKDSGSLYFVYDVSTDGYEFCGASTADLNGDGYADGCA